MERFPWHPRLRHTGIARRLVIAAVTALTLAVVAAVGMAATSATPNGCPSNKSAKTAPIADLSPPARLQIVAFDVLSGPINEQTRQLHAEGTRREHLQRQHQRRERLRDRSALQPVQHPGGRAHRGRRHHDPGLPPRRELPCERPTAAAHPLHPRDEAGRGPPRRCLDEAARRGPLRANAVSCARPRPSQLAARHVARTRSVRAPPAATTRTVSAMTASRASGAISIAPHPCRVVQPDRGATCLQTDSHASCRSQESSLGSCSPVDSP